MMMVKSKCSDIRSLKQSPWFMGSGRGIDARAATTSSVLRMKAETGGPQDTGKSCHVPFFRIRPMPAGMMYAFSRSGSGLARCFSSRSSRSCVGSPSTNKPGFFPITMKPCVISR